MPVNLFDAKTYASLYPDLAAAGLTTPEQLETHFRTSGIYEGRVPSAFVDLKYYAKSNHDLERAGLTTNEQLFSHLENAGASEGRRSSVAFNPNFYKTVNPDLAAAGLTNEQLYQHFNAVGLSEGRASSEFFNPGFYLANYSDLAAAFGNNYQAALLQFLNSGIQERRIGSIPVSPSKDPGNFPSSAYDLGTLVAKGTLVDFVGTSDSHDYYGFRVVDPISLDLSLDKPKETATQKLFADTNDNGLVDSGEEYTSRYLGSGYYFIDVTTANPATNALYTLAMSPSVIKSSNTVDPGDSQATAYSLGTLNGSHIVTDFVGNSDRLDFYNFVLDGKKNLRYFLSGSGSSMSTDLAYALIYRDTNSNGQFDSTEILGTMSSSYIYSRLGPLTLNLDAGSYFIQVFTNNPTDNTYYRMDFLVY